MKEKVYLLKQGGFTLRTINTSSLFIGISIFWFIMGIYFNSEGIQQPIDILRIYIFNVWSIIYITLLIVYFFIQKQVFFTFDGYITFNDLMGKVIFLFFNNLGHDNKKQQKNLRLKTIS